MISIDEILTTRYARYVAMRDNLKKVLDQQFDINGSEVEEGSDFFEDDEEGSNEIDGDASDFFEEDDDSEADDSSTSPSEEPVATSKNIDTQCLATVYTLIFLKVRELHDVDEEKVDIKAVGFEELPNLIVQSYKATFDRNITEEAVQSYFNEYATNGKGIRSKTASEITDADIQADISTVQDLFADVIADSDFRNGLKRSLTQKSFLTEGLNFVRDVLCDVMRENFGLHPYVGILGHPYGQASVIYASGEEKMNYVRLEDKRVVDTLQPVSIEEPMFDKKSGKYIYADSSSSLSTRAISLNNALKARGVIYENSRQYNKSKIYQNIESGNTEYLPAKAAEIVFTRGIYRTTERLDKYAKKSSAMTVEKYWEEISPVIEEEILDASEWYLEEHFEELQKQNMQKFTATTGETGNMPTVEAKIKAAKKKITPLQIFINISPNLSKTRFDNIIDSLPSFRVFLGNFLQSLCCFAILQNFESTTSCIVSSQIRLCLPKRVELNTLEVFPGEVGGNIEHLQDHFVPASNNKFGDFQMKVVQFKYVEQKALAGISPLWGYKVQEHNLEKGVASSADNILLGEDASGREVYASEKTKIKLQDNFIHNVFAGSRSGKGVMTMNIVIPQLATGKALFYLDNKPDMSSVFWRMSNKTIFALNGSKLTNTNGGLSAFDTSMGSANSKYSKAYEYLSAHPEIGTLFETPSNDIAGYCKIADYVYARGIDLFLGIMFARIQCTANEELRKRLCCDTGVVAILDEFSAINASLKTTLVNLAESYSKNFPDLNVEPDKALQIDIQAAKEKLASEQRNYEEAPDNKKHSIEQKLIDLRSRLAKLQVKASPDISEAGTYVYCMLRVLASMCSLATGSARMGWVNSSEVTNSSIYVIGQDINSNAVTADAYSNIDWNSFYRLNKDHTLNKQGGNLLNADPLRVVLEGFSALGEDWFLGRPAGNCTWQTGIIKTLRLDDWCNEAIKGWVYLGQHSLYNMLQEDVNANDIQTFKAYLVLNNATEPKTFGGTVNYANGDGFVQNMYNGIVNTVNKSSMSPSEATQVKIKVIKDMIDDNNAHGYPLENLNDLSSPDLEKDPIYQNSNAYPNLRRDKIAGEPVIQRIHPGVGFEGLLDITMQTIKNSGDEKQQKAEVYVYDSESQGIVLKPVAECNAAELLSVSGAMADWVAQKMGWSDWQDLIYDFSPDAVFTPDDVVASVLNGYDFKHNHTTDNTIRTCFDVANMYSDSKSVEGIEDSSADIEAMTRAFSEQAEEETGQSSDMSRGNFASDNANTGFNPLFGNQQVEENPSAQATYSDDEAINTKNKDNIFGNHSGQSDRKITGGDILRCIADILDRNPSLDYTKAQQIGFNLMAQFDGHMLSEFNEFLRRGI